MSATTSLGTDSTGIQSRDDSVDAEVNTLHTSVEGHGNLIA